MLAHSNLHKKAFTLVELIVSIAIFVAMTALMVAKYGNFNNSVLLTNMAYDIALTIRTAQTYGLSVQGQSSGSNILFQYPYGVAFCAKTTGNCGGGSETYDNQSIVMFADSSPLPRGAYNATDITVATYGLTRGVKVAKICTKSGAVYNCTTSAPVDRQRVDISFARPNPDAIICLANNNAGAQQPNSCSGIFTGANPQASYVAIVIQAPDGSTRDIVVQKTGQISVEDLGL